MLTYVEGNSLHPERGGASTFARYAFNELWSFIAGWAILLDYLIVMAIGAFAVPHYLAAFWGEAGDAGRRDRDRRRGDRVRGRGRTCAASRADAAADSCCGSSLLNIVLLARDHRGRRCATLFDLGLITDSIDLGTHARVGRPDLRRGDRRGGRHRHRGGVGPRRRAARRAGAGCARVTLVGALAVLVLLGGMSVVALMAVPVERRRDRARRRASSRRRCSGWCRAFDPTGWPTPCATWSARWRALVLVQAVNGQMLGHRRGWPTRWRPTARSRACVGRLHDAPLDAVRGDRDLRRCSPSALALPADVEFLAGHLRLRRDAGVHDRPPVGDRAALPRARPPERRSGCRCRCGSAAARSRCRPRSARCWRRRRWVSVVVLHEGARIAGGDLDARRARAVRDLPARAGQAAAPSASRSPRRRCRSAQERRVRQHPRAGLRRASSTTTSWAPPGGWPPRRPSEGEGGAMLEALYVFEIPMSLPIDARVPPTSGSTEAQARAGAARRRWARSTRASRWPRRWCAAAPPARRSWRRRSGAGWRRSCWPPRSRRRIRGGALLGGRGRARDRFVGRDHPLRGREGAVQGDPHRAAGAATPEPAERPEP